MAQSDGIIVYGTTWCSDCTRSKRVLDKAGISYSWIDVDIDPKGWAYVQKENGGKRVVPTIVFPDGDVLVEPSDKVLGAKVDRLISIK